MSALLSRQCSSHEERLSIQSTVYLWPWLSFSHHKPPPQKKPSTSWLSPSPLSRCRAPLPGHGLNLERQTWPHAPFVSGAFLLQGYGFPCRTSDSGSSRSIVDAGRPTVPVIVSRVPSSVCVPLSRVLRTHLPQLLYALVIGHYCICFQLP